MRLHPSYIDRHIICNIKHNEDAFAYVVIDSEHLGYNMYYYVTFPLFTGVLQGAKITGPCLSQLVSFPARIYSSRPWPSSVAIGG